MTGHGECPDVGAERFSWTPSMVYVLMMEGIVLMVEGIVLMIEDVKVME